VKKVIRMTSRPAASEIQPTGSSGESFSPRSVVLSVLFVIIMLAVAADEPSAYSTGLLSLPRSG